MGGAKNCPETPRQKMIGMMYLVLTAMLALNVSTIRVCILLSLLRIRVMPNSITTSRLLMQITPRRRKSGLIKP